MKSIAVFFPGIGYHCDKPLLYYSRKLAVSGGYSECVNISYSYDGGDIRGNEVRMNEAFACLLLQAERQLESVNWTEYDRILFISKSIGTVVATRYAARHIVNAGQVLYTPLKEAFECATENAIVFIGDADAWSDCSLIVRTSRDKGIPVYVYEGCNHSLECSDAMRNIEIVKNVMELTNDYIK